MASTLIHVAVAKEINKVINRNEYELMLGSMAPDLAKIVGDNKLKSHFLDFNNNIPNIDKFLNKYKNNLNNDFVLGYYIHLYTDYLWFKYFISEVQYKDSIQTLDGKILSLTENKFVNYIYNDYTSLNTNIIDEYNIPIDLFYNPLPKLENIINEIPMDKLNLLVDKAGLILIKSKEEKSLIFNLDNIKRFIEFSTEIILSEIKKLNI